MRWLYNGLAFAAAFLATAAGLRQLVPQRLKFAWFAEHRAAIDTVFLGSSHVFRQIDPALFDRELAARGVSTRSFNFGVPGMRMAETLYAAERLAAMQPSKLRFLLVELQSLSTEIEPENYLTERLVYWHSPRSTWLLCRAVLADPDLNLGHKLRLLAGHLHHLAHYLGNLGRGLEIAAARMGRSSATFTDRPSLGPALDGYRPLEIERDPNYRERRRLFLDDLEDFRRRKEELGGAPPAGAPDPLLRAALRDFTARLERKGVRALFLVMPVMEDERRLWSLAQDGVPLLAFNDPHLYPDLYRADRRFDLHHLNRRGTEELTALLAAEFAAWLAQQGAR